MTFSMAAAAAKQRNVEMLEAAAGYHDQHQDQPSFVLTTNDLQDLMQTRGAEGVARLQHEFGGVVELCRRLLTSPTEGR